MGESKLTIVPFKDNAGEWRWHMKAENGNIVCTGGEGYKNKSDMLDMIRRLQFDFEYSTIEGDG